MIYPPYQKPSIASITMSFGGPQFPIFDGVLSYHDDAAALAAGVGATLINAATDKTSMVKFVGVNTTDAAQPWRLIFPDGSSSWAGDSINSQVKANGGTIGNPGSWALVNSLPIWTPTPVVVPPVTPVNLPDAAAAFAKMLGVTSTTPENFQNEILYGMRAVLHVMGIEQYKAPGGN